MGVQPSSKNSDQQETNLGGLNEIEQHVEFLYFYTWAFGLFCQFRILGIIAVVFIYGTLVFVPRCIKLGPILKKLTARLEVSPC